MGFSFPAVQRIYNVCLFNSLFCIQLQEEVITVLEKTCDDLGPELSGMVTEYLTMFN